MTYVTGENPSKTIIFIYNGENLANPSSIHCRCSPGDRDFRYAAIEAGEVVWKSGLVKKVGLADGVSGNSYAFLSLYRLTGETVYEERAKAFAGFLYHNAKERIRWGWAENTCSRFQGLAGTACLWFDLLDPEGSRFPGYKL